MQMRPLVHYVRVKVKNDSRSTAKDCMAYLTKIERMNEHGHYVTLHQDPLPLGWAFIGQIPRNLPPQIEFFFDVFSTKSFENRVIPETQPKALIWKSILTGNATYRFSVVVTGENVEPLATTVEVEWNAWNNFVVWSGDPAQKTIVNDLCDL